MMKNIFENKNEFFFIFFSLIDSTEHYFDKKQFLRLHFIIVFIYYFAFFYRAKRDRKLCVRRSGISIFIM